MALACRVDMNLWRGGGQGTDCSRQKKSWPKIPPFKCLEPINMLLYVPKRTLQMLLNSGSWDGETTRIFKVGPK